jgi:multiple sugar transport system permease protein
VDEEQREVRQVISPPATGSTKTSGPLAGMSFRYGRRTKHGHRSERRREAAFGYAFLAPNLAGFALFVGLPVIASAVLSLYNWPLSGHHTYIGLGNYRTAFNNPLFGAIIHNTLYYAVVYVPVCIVLALVGAAMLSSRGNLVLFKRAYRVIFLLPAITPIVTNAVIFSLIFQQNGIFNTMLGFFGIHGPNWFASSDFAMPAVIIMSVWQGVGYNLLLFIAAVEGIPGTLYDAAAIDGAGALRQFRHITLPLVSPATFFVLLTTMISAFQVFGQIYVLTGGGPGNSTTTMVYGVYEEAFQLFHLGYASAFAWVLFMMVLVLTVINFIGQKRWVHYEH